MSKMTQRRMTRRASRKLAHLRGVVRRHVGYVASLKSNLASAFNVIRIQRDRLKNTQEPINA